MGQLPCPEVLGDRGGACPEVRGGTDSMSRGAGR